MTVLRLAEVTWTEVAALGAEQLVAILPVGATEAHGPHLPLSTDDLIAGAMAEAGAERLSGRGFDVLILPPLSYTAASFARGFPGTVSVSPESVTALVRDIAGAVATQRADVLAIANAHLDPANLGCLHAAVESVRSSGTLLVAFPDITRRPWTERLSEEFRSGACHAGRYEGSVVRAVREDLFRSDVAARLAPNPVSLSRAIAEGRSSFEESDGPQAYFGDPAAATADEGERTIAELGAILEEAVLESLARQKS